MKFHKAAAVTFVRLSGFMQHSVNKRGLQTFKFCNKYHILSCLFITRTMALLKLHSSTHSCKNRLQNEISQVSHCLLSGNQLVALVRSSCGWKQNTGSAASPGAVTDYIQSSRTLLLQGACTSKTAQIGYRFPPV